jgi:cytochrome oxidase Cu insertion factor (SCO1/SenC/PrrC family)
LRTNSAHLSLGERVRLRRVVWAATAALVAGIGAAVVAHLLLAAQSSQATALPELHGQMSWPAGARPAPLFALPDVLGGTTSLAGLRGHVTLVAFLDSRCTNACPFLGQALSDAEEALPVGARPAVVVVSIAPADDDATSVRAAMRRWQAPGGWHWLTGTSRQLDPVWRAYGLERGRSAGAVPDESALYLVDADGDERAGYVPPILPTFLALDIQRLER